MWTCAPVPNSIPFCLVYNSNALCAQCEPGKLRASPTECAAPTVPIPRCLEYNFDGTCRICETGYYPSGNTCAAVAGVSNCLVASPVTCRACSPNYFLSSYGAYRTSAADPTPRSPYTNLLSQTFLLDKTLV